MSHAKCRAGGGWLERKTVIGLVTQEGTRAEKPGCSEAKPGREGANGASVAGPTAFPRPSSLGRPIEETRHVGDADLANRTYVNRAQSYTYTLPTPAPPYS
jgi:hypothetical protein